MLNNTIGSSVTQRASIDSLAGATITQGANHTISGNGRITAELISEGTVRSDADFLQLITSDKTNTGTFEAANGGTLQVLGIDVTNSGGLIFAEDASTVTLRSNARVIGGTLDTSGTGSILVDSGSAFLQDATNEGTLGVIGSDNLQLENGLTNNGTVTINSNGGNADTQLNAATSLTIDGTGEIVLNNTLGATVPQRASIDSATDQVLTQGADHTIRGNGRITAALINDGTIRSGNSFLQLITNDKTNNGLIEAADGGVLQILGIDVTNSGGLISVDDASTVTLRSNARIIGGALQTSGSGSILVDSGSAFLRDVTNEGTLGVIGGQNLQLEDSFTNNGSFTINSNDANADTQLVAATSLTIDGTGEILLNNTLGPTVPQRASIDAAPGEMITQGADHTIRGRGRITAALINNGLVSAEGGLLQLRDGNKTNNNSFVATDSGELRLDSVLVSNAAGTITADNGTVSVRGGSEIQGGVLNSLNDGTFNIDSGIGILDGVTSNATINVIASDTLQLENGFTNNGTVTINSNESNSDTQLIAANSLTIDGTGEIVLNNLFAGGIAPERAGIDAAAGETITQAAGHTIRGNGRITAALVNNGLVSVEGSGNLIQLLDEGKTNNSSFIATDGGELRLDTVLVDNAAGTITADNGTVSVRGGSEIQGGVLDSLNEGTFNIDSGIGILDGVTSNATINVASTDTLQLENSFTNNGTVTINSNGGNSNTQAVAATSLTIDGTGEIVLNNPFTGGTAPERASIDAAAGETITQAAGHTIRGNGRITAALVNNGLVSAEGSGGFLQLLDGDKTNNGTFQALDGSSLTTLAETNLTNFEGGVLTGGTYRVVDEGNGASMSIAQGPLFEVGPSTEIVLSGINSALTFGETPTEDSLSTNRGTIRILNNRDYQLTANVTTFDNFGTIELGGGTLSGVGLVEALSNRSTGEFFGFGVLDGPVANEGLVRANGGTLTISTISGQNGTVQIDAASSLDVSDPTLGSSSAANLIHNGDDLNLGTNDFTVASDYTNANFGVGNAFNARANVTGSGQILADPSVAQTVTGDVTNSTQPSVVLDFGNVRVGDSSTLNYAVNNAGTTGPDLRGALQTDDSAGNGGNITDSRLTGSGVTAQNYGPVAAGSATSDLDVTFNATTAGSLAGQQVAIVNNFDNVDNQVLNFSGTAFTSAEAEVTPTIVDFGIVHVGDALTPADITVANNAPVGAFSEDLRAENFIASGDVQIQAGTSTSITLQAGDAAIAVSALFDTATAGERSGSVSIDLISTGQIDGVTAAGLGELGLGTETVQFIGTVNNFADPTVVQLAGVGTLSETSPDEYLLDFGTLLQGDPSVQGELGLLNDVLGPADTLAGEFNLLGSAFTLNGFGPVGDIAAGETEGGFLVGIDTATAGLFSTSILFNPFSENASGFSGALDQVTINVRANVTANAVPEPGSIAVLTIVGLGAMLRRRR